MDIDIDKLKKSDFFCIAPWTHMIANPDGRTWACCLTAGGGGNYGSLYENTLEEIWNSDQIKKMRLDMLNGVKRPECKVCHQLEKNQLESYRNEFNEKFSDHFEFVKETKEDGTFDRFNLVSWDFRLSNTCNFKCRMCSSLLSSSWGEEIRQQSPNTDITPIIKIDKPSLWSEINNLCPMVEQVYFAGGEPLIMDSHYEILDKLIDHKKFNVSLVYSTNFSTLTYKDKNIFDYWEKFPNLFINLSIDGFEERGEFIRKGLNWNKFVDNVKKFHKKFKNSETKLRIFVTAQLLNSVHIIDLHKKLYEEEIIKNLDDFVISPLTDPSCMSVQCLPFKFKKQLVEDIMNHIKFYLKPRGAIEAISQFAAYVKFLLEESSTERLEQFVLKMKDLDKIRNEDVRKVFPEFEEIIWKPYADLFAFSIEELLDV